MNKDFTDKNLGLLVKVWIALFVPYIFLAFVSWKFDPRTWEEGSRFILAMLWILSLGFTFKNKIESWLR